MPLSPPPDLVLLPMIQRALDEDLGLGGDVTSMALIDADQQANAAIIARSAGRVAGLPCARLCFAQIDDTVRFESVVADGADVSAGEVVARLSGPTRSLLAGERVALNFLGHLSGIATHTQAMVTKLEGTKARLCCTRKTLPGLRVVEKYAVRAGGGVNHRFGLGDAILIKDNHILAAGGVENALKSARAHAGHMTRIEIEVDTLAQLNAALPHKPDVIMLDNMDIQILRQAVVIIDNKVISEASGGVSLQTIAAIAATGVDMISTSAITMSAPALDLGLDFVS
ncbi:MAG: nicotinate-nucleotide diphosphorylase (carboxylating) [Robiginitomaculum sp.]|nr:MAG: nicotinate-nucleotide diphosphorylase (carboxylating) [Robiginitomaculum sp.]